MATELSGVLVLNQISEDDGATWLTIVCEDTSTITGTSATTTKKTKCGAFSTTSNDPVTVTGSGVAGGDLEADEMSYMRMQILRDSLTPVLFRRMNSAFGEIAAGALSYALFTGLLTEVSETSSTEEAVSFNWSISSTGTVAWEQES